MKSIQSILFFTVALLVLVSCNNQQSMDEFYINHQEKQGFMVVDIPTSVLKLDESTLTEAQRESYASVNKLNFLAFKKSESDQATYEAAKKELKLVLDASKYEELIKFSDSEKSGVIKYLGTPTAIKELVFFGSEDETGFAVVRILGDKMNPQNLLELLSTIKDGNVDTKELKKIADFFIDTPKEEKTK